MRQPCGPGGCSSTTWCAYRACAHQHTAPVPTLLRIAASTSRHVRCWHLPDQRQVCYAGTCALRPGVLQANWESNAIVGQMHIASKQRQGRARPERACSPMVRASPCGPSSSESERSAGSPRQPSADVRNISRSRIVASTQRCPIRTTHRSLGTGERLRFAAFGQVACSAYVRTQRGHVIITL